LGYAVGFSPATVATRSTLFGNTRSFSINMTDEVAAAKEAAANYKSSDGDGAGPATVFDKLLRYVQQSPRVPAQFNMNPAIYLSTLCIRN
jgi:hypothetical protein